MSLVVSSGAAIAVALFLQTPAQLGNSVSSYYWILGSRTVAARPIEASSSDSGKERVRESKASVVSVEEPVEAAFGFGVVSYPIEPIEITVPETPLPPPAPPIHVVKESVYLYALNHGASPVVTTLTKGEVVEPQMQVNENGQEWSYVRVPALRISGYLPTDWIELK